MSRNMKRSLKGARPKAGYDGTSKEYVERRMDALKRGRLSPKTVEAKLDELLDMTLEEKIGLMKVLLSLLSTAKEACKDGSMMLDDIIDAVEKDGMDIAVITALGYSTLMFTDTLAFMLKDEMNKMESEKR